MAQLVVQGAVLMCSFGTGPCTYSVLPTNCTQASSMSAGTIQHQIPYTNIPGFIMCTSLSNPAVASATSAALGVLTPQACTPVIPAPWATGSPTVQIGGQPALSNSSTLNCAYGGVITVTSPGQVTVTVA
jgi:uncharacterized Zn-binding protein involved in type VI secretion